MPEYKPGDIVEFLGGSRKGQLARIVAIDKYLLDVEVLCETEPVVRTFPFMEVRPFYGPYNPLTGKKYKNKDFSKVAIPITASQLLPTESVNEGKEQVNHPAHYNQGSIEVIDFIDDQNLGFYEANIIKYVSRYQYKGGIKDLEKAKFYLDRLIKKYER